MKVKILVALLIIVVIALGALLGMKYVMDKEEGNNTIAENTNDPMQVILEEKKEPEKPKSKYDGTKRTLAVVIDNVGSAVPQTSMNEAMIVYEATVEGGLTRFLAIYKDPKSEDIGPSRSARPYFIDYALENDSILVHYGGSPKALNEIKQLKMEDVDGMDSPGKVFWRTNEKSAPHNAIVKVAETWKYIESKNYRTTTKERNVLNYIVEEREIEEGQVANKVNIPYSTSKVNFRYNADTKLYERYVGNKVQKDWLSGEVLTAKNIIITFAKNYTTDEENGYGRQAIVNIGTLDGYYITNGKAEKIKCKKSTRAGRTTYQYEDGTEIEVNDGNTYIQIVPIDLNVTFE